MSTGTCYTTLDDENGSEWPVKVEYNFHRSRKGDTGGHGEPLEPDEGASVDITSIFRKQPIRDQDDLQWVLFESGSDSDYKDLTEKCLIDATNPH